MLCCACAAAVTAAFVKIVDDKQMYYMACPENNRKVGGRVLGSIFSMFLMMHGTPAQRTTARWAGGCWGSIFPCFS